MSRWLRLTPRQGLIVAHCYQYEPDRSTWVIETDEQIAALRQHCQYVIVDRARSTGDEYAPPRVTGLDLFHAGHEVVVLRTFSKAWGLAGARIGYAVMAPALRAVARSAQDTFEVSAAAFEAARASLDASSIGTRSGPPVT